MLWQASSFSWDMLQGQPSEGRNVPPNYLELVRDASYRALIIQELTENVAKMKRARAVTQSTGQGHILAPESGLDGKGHFYGASMPVSLRHQRTLDSLYEQRLSVGFCARPDLPFLPCCAAVSSWCKGIRGARWRCTRTVREAAFVTPSHVCLPALFCAPPQEPCDINEHMATLRQYASKCGVVAEMGVRNVVATYAFMKGLEESGAATKKLFCVDIEPVDFSPEQEMAAKFGDPTLCVRGRPCA